VAPDPRHSSATEERTWLIGESDNEVVVVIFTMREAGGVTRLISARRASRRERKRYEEAKGISV
jgi:uncharacterized DUF497 family protein